MSRTPSILLSHISGILKPLARLVAPCSIALLAVLAASERASGLWLEQARANCRETVGHPIVHACMQGMGKGGDREANLAKCRAGVQPQMTACVHAALNAANGRANVAIEVYKNGKPKADVVAPGNALPAGFVAPPPTIAEISPVLAHQKPAPSMLPNLKADADIPPAKQSS